MTPDLEAAALVAARRASYERAGPVLHASRPESDALDAGGFADLIRRHRYGVLATARPDARARTPIAYLLTNGAFWIGTVEGLRLRNLRARRWASLVVMEGGRSENEGPCAVSLTARSRKKDR